MLEDIRWMIMREIKFRGKDLETGKWVYGYYCDTADGDTPHHIYLGGYEYAVDPETVGQYTSLHDKNGIEIYEGDKIKVHYVGVVYDNSSRSGVSDVDSWRTVIVDDIRKINNIIDKGNYGANEIEVIGNIYENPEMLEASK